MRFLLCTLTLLLVSTALSAQDPSGLNTDTDTVQSLGTIIDSQLNDRPQPIVEPVEGETTNEIAVPANDDDAAYSESNDTTLSTPTETEDLPDDVILDPDFLSDEDGKNYDDYNAVTVRILDKITAESRTFDLNVERTVAFGSLRIRPMTCKKSPPIEEPESASFLQIWEKMPTGEDEWIFSGWMFASSPSLSAMDHPVYDVWVIDCKDNQE